MAAQLSHTGQEGCGVIPVADTAIEVNQTPRRCSSTSSSSPPPRKSPRTEFPSTTVPMPDTGEGRSDEPQIQPDNMEKPASPPASSNTGRKSWRRSTLSRRSLPTLPNPYHILCRNISTSLSQEKRLEKLMEASKELALERLQTTLQSMSTSSTESFQKQVDNMQKEWSSLAKSLGSKPQSDPNPLSSSDRGVIQTTINRLQAESESWEALLNKHRRKAEELKRKLSEGQKESESLDWTSIAQSSQYQVIQSKPDFHGVLSRQQLMLHNMTMIMDTQCKMVRILQSIKQHSQVVVKETSGRLATEAGFEDHSPDVIKDLMMAPL